MDMYKVVPSKFDLKDINKDGIPELLMGDAYQILTYKDGYAVWLFDSWVMCEMYYSESTNRIMYVYSWNDYSDWYIFEIDMEAGKFKTIDNYSYNEGIYYRGEEKSTKNDIMKDIDKYMPGKILLSTPYKNTEENRAKYLSPLSPIRISKEKITVYAKGEKSKLTIEGTESKIKWYSSDKSIAKVTKYGNVYGLKHRKCNITAEVDGKIYECIVIVKKIDINKLSLELKVGDEYTLKINGNKEEVKWSSSEVSVVTVSKKGKEKGAKKGKATIKATVGNVTYTCKVTVK